MTTDERLADLMKKVEEYGDHDAQVRALKSLVSAAYERGFTDGSKSQRKMTRLALVLEEVQ